ncbi:undecaprenyl-diphosphatase [Clostridium collagenovorans DSM 3089]|uniref:Undecaprenyl-diphosphatase n=1 Tax=Clostridium collagenovorans DSM 3089 TaxID=1121306 RepID=A0A1M5XFN4_9CLOT|nr:phosphatase PAP2 family protein [Clostridium collagenovorans]SHH98601.1 undecaprenyl-diphosphatase [Clostridium collagenovorans DSM 3089]
MKDKSKIFIVASVLLFIILATGVNLGITLDSELWIYNFVVRYMSPGLTNVLKVITNLGSAIPIIIFCVVLFIIPKSRKTIAFPVSITLIVSTILNSILKNLFLRERPNILRLVQESSYSFPSGHSMSSAALYTILILVTLKYIENNYKRNILCVFFACMPIIIGLSRIYLGVHYAGDVLGGWLLGSSVAVLVYSLWYKEEKYKLKYK